MQAPQLSVYWLFQPEIQPTDPLYPAKGKLKKTHLYCIWRAETFYESLGPKHQSCR